MHKLRLSDDFLLGNDKGTSNIEGIGFVDGNNKTEHRENDDVLYGPDEDDNDSKDKGPVEVAGLASMDRLRLLNINHFELKGRCKRMPKRIKWQQCPLKSLPPDFHLKEVAALDLSYSNINKVKRNLERPSRNNRYLCFPYATAIHVSHLPDVNNPAHQDDIWFFRPNLHLSSLRPAGKAC